MYRYIILLVAGLYLYTKLVVSLLRDPVTMEKVFFYIKVVVVVHYRTYIGIGKYIIYLYEIENISFLLNF